MARRISGEGRVTVSLRRSTAVVLAACFSGSEIVCVAETGFIACSCSVFLALEIVAQVAAAICACRDLRFFGIATARPRELPRCSGPKASGLYAHTAPGPGYK